MADAAPPTEAEGVAILLWAADPAVPERLATPFFHAAAAAAMDCRVEIYFTAGSVRLLVPGVAAGLHASPRHDKTIWDNMREAVALGAHLYACTDALHAQGLETVLLTGDSQRAGDRIAAELGIDIVHAGVGAITESDIGLAEASEAPVIGFNVRANAPARASANQKGVEIRYYSIIYDLVDDIKAVASGLLSAEIREHFIGYAEIKEVFRVTGVGNVAGCIVTEGVARRSAGVRLLRDDVVIHEGTLKTLKRFKDEVKEVQSGQECGMAFENYDDIRKGDVIEIFERQEVERTLE